MHHGITIDPLHHALKGVYDTLSLEVLQSVQTDGHLAEHVDTVQLDEHVVLVQVVEESLK